MAKTTTRSTTKSRSAGAGRGSASKTTSRSAAKTGKTATKTAKKTRSASTRSTSGTRASTSTRKTTTRAAASARNGTARNGAAARKSAITRNSPSSGKKKKALRELAENVEEAREVAEEIPAETQVDEQDARRAQELDTHFNQLTDITDQVALVNSNYDSDLEESFDRMEKFVQDAMGWDLQELTPRALKTYLSHMSFHREIVAEIISEARRQLMEGRRGYLKRLVSYHKEFMTWFARVEKKYAA